MPRTLSHYPFNNFFTQRGTSFQRTSEYISWLLQESDVTSYLVFKEPRSLQVFRMHELSLCIRCCIISLIRVQHNPKLSSAVQTPATLLTPCLGATDALLLCQTTVICDGASIDRATSLSSWDYSCDVIAVAQQHLIKDQVWLIPCLPSSISICEVKLQLSMSWHVRSTWSVP